MPLIPWVKPISDELTRRADALRESFARVRLTSGVSEGEQCGRAAIVDLYKPGVDPVFKDLVRAHRQEKNTMIIELYKGRGRMNPWRWRLLSKNGKIVADSAEGYHNSSNLRRAARRLPIKAVIRWA